jgi:hypothetical protein
LGGPPGTHAGPLTKARGSRLLILPLAEVQGGPSSSLPIVQLAATGDLAPARRTEGSRGRYACPVLFRTSGSYSELTAVMTATPTNMGPSRPTVSAPDSWRTPTRLTAKQC